MREKQDFEKTAYNQYPATVPPRRNHPWLMALLISALPLIATRPADAATTYTLRPVADTVVKQAFPNSNYGTQASLTIRFTASGQADYSFLRFSIPALAGSVTSATLSLRVTGAIQEVGAYSVDMASPTWAESSLTWNNWQAGSIFTYLGSQTNLSPGATYSQNVTSWVGSPNVTFAVASGADVSGQSFSSREGSVVPTLTLVTSGTLATCSTPDQLLLELNSLVQTGNLLYGCDYRPRLSPTFGSWQGGSENLPVIAAAIALFDGPVVNGTDYRLWWPDFFNQQASTTGSGNINYFKGSELFSNVYDAATVGGVLMARYWANFNANTTIRDLAAAYLRRTWFAWALSTSPQGFDAIYRNQGSIRTFITGPGESCPTLAMASPRSKMLYGQDSKRWLLAKMLGFNQNCYKMPSLKPLIDFATGRYPAVSGLTTAEKTALDALINNTILPGDLATILGAIRMKTDFHFLLWSDGRRATFYLGHQLNNNINVSGGKHTVFTALFDPGTKELDLLFAEGQNNQSCADNAGNRIVVDDLTVSDCSSTNWFPMPLDPPTHHFALGPSGWRSCFSLTCP